MYAKLKCILILSTTNLKHTVNKFLQDYEDIKILWSSIDELKEGLKDLQDEEEMKDDNRKKYSESLLEQIILLQNKISYSTLNY